MRTLKIIYLTTIHLMLAAGSFLYMSDTYTLARMEHEPKQEARSCCNTDELTALLESKQRRGR